MSSPALPLPFPDDLLTPVVALAERNVAELGQVFTPSTVVAAMLALRRNAGRVLEPSCGDGAFLRHLPGAVGIELDRQHCPPGAQVLDFFAYPVSEKFATVIGNPPYVRFQDIPEATRRHLDLRDFDARSNLYLFFIRKALRHLVDGGELIFITPRDFLKATSAVRLNTWMYEHGTITDAIELGDARIFTDAVPNCLIWRYVLGDRTRRTRYAEIGFASGSASGDELATALAAPRWSERHFVEAAGHLYFTRGDYPLHLSDIASVKVGAVSGLDEVYCSDAHGNRDFVCSETQASGQTRRMIWCEPGEPPPEALLPHKERLLARRIKSFDESNWWQWGRAYPLTRKPRLYVNGKTRRADPFFRHRCLNFDGSVLALFPQREDVDLDRLRDRLNRVDWADLGFVCDGRFLFTQRSLENAPLPAEFREFLPAERAAGLAD